MVRYANKDEMFSIRFLLDRGYVVTGNGYQYSIVDGWFTANRIDAVSPEESLGPQAQAAHEVRNERAGLPR